MPASVDPTLDNVFKAMARWEQLALPTCGVTQSSAFTAYAYFPTQAQFAAGLAYPYTVHGADVTAYEKVSINNTPNAEVENIHTFWTGLMYGQDGDPYDVLAQRDAQWREAYLEQFVKHMQLIDPATGGSLRAQMILKTAVPLSFDLFGRTEIGLKYSIEVWARRTLATAP
jgi:hypothetical protein